MPFHERERESDATYFGLYDRAVTIYEPYRNGTALLSTMRNDGDYTNVQVGVTGTLRLLQNSLIVQVTPRLTHYASTGYYDTHHNPFSYLIYAQYYLKQFNFTAYYGSREYSMSEASNAYSRQRSYYNVSAGWGNGTWAVSAQASCFLRYGRKAGITTDLNSPCYTSRTLQYSGNYTGNFSVSVTYTIGYGKKIQPGDEIGSMSGAGSAVMK